MLKKSFNFDEIREFAKHPDLTILFDGMHGAGGPFAQRILVEELGFPKVNFKRILAFFCTTFTPFIIFLSYVFVNLIMKYI